MVAHRIFWLTLSLILVVIGIGAFAAWGVVSYTASPSFCASCHLMQTRYVSWQRSPHWGKATCIQCHSEPGIWGELKAHLNGTRYLYVMLTGEKSGPILRAAVESATCAHCHPAESLPEATRAQQIRHRAHLALGIECTACHAGLVHGTLYGHQAKPAREACVACHAKESPVLGAIGASAFRPPQAPAEDSAGEL
ncbi:MAG: NapC/NirT family cytochrome c [candidate division NC10 bacterium]|nr:NapC/NirT family cytochrome c [candidate division NC10 bacterium]